MSYSNLCGMFPLNRREVLRAGLYSAFGLLLGNRAAWPLIAAAPQAKAKSVIQIWMWGGPAHLDTFDPKPDAGNDYCGPLKTPIATNVGGIRISELLPLLAKQADKYSLIRGMTHGVNSHETASGTWSTHSPRRPSPTASPTTSDCPTNTSASAAFPTTSPSSTSCRRAWRCSIPWPSPSAATPPPNWWSSPSSSPPCP